jgi:hypothetical protein
VGASVTPGAAERGERARFMISAHESDLASSVAFGVDRVDDEVWPRPLRQEVSDEHDVAVWRPPPEPPKQAGEFFAASMHISDDDRVSHARRISLRCRSALCRRHS